MLTEPRDVDWLREQIAKLPGSAISALQAGPIQGAEQTPVGLHSCRVCAVLKPLERDDPQPDRDLLATGNPATDLLDYHAVEGDPDKPADEGPPQDRAECYRRCLQIYEAAGWRPDARG